MAVLTTDRMPKTLTYSNNGDFFDAVGEALRLIVGMCLGHSHLSGDGQIERRCSEY